MRKGFMVRVTILPLGAGEAGLWLGAVPGDLDSVKKEAEKRGMNEYDVRVPTLQVSLGTAQTGAQALLKMGPKEGSLVSKLWGMYPILLVGITPGAAEDNLYYV